MNYNEKGDLKAPKTSREILESNKKNKSQSFETNYMCTGIPWRHVK
jgi:hypothetical protein